MAQFVANYSENDVPLEQSEDSLDVPLISNFGDNYKTPCLCHQPGFGPSKISNDVKEAKLKIILTTVLCVIFMITEFIGGYLSGSLAIATDAAHLFSDCISFVVGILAIWISNKPADRRMSFGYKRAEVLGAIISVMGIWALTVVLFYFAIERLLTADFLIDADTMMIVAGIGIAMNITMVLILHGSIDLSRLGFHSHSHLTHKDSNCGLAFHKHNFDIDVHTLVINHNENEVRPRQGSILHRDMNKHLISVNLSDEDDNKQNEVPNVQIFETNSADTHQKEHNLNLRAAIIHVLGDLIQSIGVFIASIIIKFNPQAKLADPICTLLFSLIVICTTYKIMKESILVLLDAVPDSISLVELENDLNNIEGVKAVHHLNVWSHSVNYHIMMAHLNIDDSADSTSILKTVTALALNKYKIKHSTLQIERMESEHR